MLSFEKDCKCRNLQSLLPLNLPQRAPLTGRLAEDFILILWLPVLKEERGKVELEIHEGILIGERRRRGGGETMTNDIINILQPLFTLVKILCSLLFILGHNFN